MSDTIILVIPEKNLRVFGRMLKCLAKLGEEMSMDISQKGVVLRTLNSSCSAFAAIRLESLFFESIGIKEGGSFKGTVKIKPCLPAFRPASVQNASNCILSIIESGTVLEVVIGCSRGMKKRYSIPFVANEDALEARYDRTSPSRLIVRPKVFLDSLSRFHIMPNDELTCVFPIDNMTENILLRNTQPNSGGPDSSAPMMYSELQLNLAVLEKYDIGQDCAVGDTITVTFSMKEFREIVKMFDVAGQPFTMTVTGSGQPIYMSSKFFNVYQMDFILATITDTQSVPQSRQESAPSPAPASKHSQTQIPPARLSAPEQTSQTPAAVAMSARQSGNTQSQPHASSAPQATIGATSDKSPYEDPPDEDLEVPMGRLCLADTELDQEPRFVDGSDQSEFSHAQDALAQRIARQRKKMVIDDD